MYIKFFRYCFFIICVFVASISVSFENGFTEENRFEVAGFENPNEAPNFLFSLQNNLKENNKKNIAQVTFFPSFVFIDGEEVVIMK